MKRLDQLQALVKTLKQKEINQFEKYCEYKSNKKILKLFNLFVKYKEETTTERLEISIKRNNLQRNLRRRVNELFELIIDYIDDIASDNDGIRRVNKMIRKAQILARRGLIDEACKIFGQVIKETQDTANVEQALLALRILYSINSIFDKENVPELSVNFLEDQSKLGKKINEFNEIHTLYRDGLYWLKKGIEMLEEDELNQLLEIRERGIEIIENRELPFMLYIFIASLLATLYSCLSPANLQLAEKYHLNILKRFYEVDYYIHRNYYGLYNSYLTFLAGCRRVEDYNTNYKKLLKAHLKTKTNNVTIVGLIHTATLRHCLLDYNVDKANETLNKALEYVNEYYHVAEPSIVRLIIFICFELTIIKADLNHAGLLIVKLNESKSFSKYMKQFNLTVRIAELLLNYEKKNYQWVINQEDSIKRLYSRHLKRSIGYKLLLKLLVQLSSTPNRKEKSILLTKFSQELTSLFEQQPEQRFAFLFGIIEDWIAAKLNGNHSIAEYKAENLASSTQFNPSI